MCLLPSDTSIARAALYCLPYIPNVQFVSSIVEVVRGTCSRQDKHRDALLSLEGSKGRRDIPSAISLLLSRRCSRSAYSLEVQWNGRTDRHYRVLGDS